MNYDCKYALNGEGIVKRAAWIEYILVTSIWNKKVSAMIVLAWGVS